NTIASAQQHPPGTRYIPTDPEPRTPVASIRPVQLPPLLPDQRARLPHRHPRLHLHKRVSDCSRIAQSAKPFVPDSQIQRQPRREPERILSEQEPVPFPIRALEVRLATGASQHTGREKGRMVRIEIAVVVIR